MKRWLALVLIVMVTMTTCGCWSRRELDTLGVVMGMGIDRAKEDGKISLTIQILKPAEAKKGTTGEGVWTITSSGYTVFDAFRNATMQSERELFLSHNKVIVIGEELARAGIAPLVDFLDRAHEPRRLSYFVIAKGEAKDIILAEHEQESIPAKAIENMIKLYGDTSMAASVNLHEFLKMLASKTTDPIASRIELIGAEGMEREEDSQKRLRLTGAAAFLSDKLVGWLNRSETRGFNWIVGKVKSGIIVVKSPIDESQYVSIEIIRASSKIIPEIQDGKVSVTVKINQEGNFKEQMSNVNLTQPELFSSLERRQAEVIRNEIDAVLQKAQKEWGADIFGFGEAVRREFPKVWKGLEERWHDEFQNVEVRVQVDAKLRRTGVISTPAKSR